MFCVASDTRRSTFISSNRTPKIPFNQTVIIPTLGRTLLHRLLSYCNVGESSLSDPSSSSSSLFEDVGMCIETIFENPPPPQLSSSSSSMLPPNSIDLLRHKSARQGRGGSSPLHEVIIHPGGSSSSSSSVLGIVGDILLKDLASWILRIAERHLHDEDGESTTTAVFHAALKDIEMYGRTFCLRDVGKVRGRQYAYLKSRYEEERSRIDLARRGSGDKDVMSSIRGHTVDSDDCDVDEGFDLGFMELLCDVLEISNPPTTTDPTATSTSTAPPTANFGRLQRNCNTYNITTTHPTRLKGKRAFAYVMNVLQSTKKKPSAIPTDGEKGYSSSPVATSSSTADTPTSMPTGGSIVVADDEVQPNPTTPTLLSSVPIVLCHVFPSSPSSTRRRGGGSQVDVSPMGVVCLWEVLLYAIRNNERFVGTLQPDHVALSTWTSSSSRSAASAVQATVAHRAEHRHRHDDDRHRSGGGGGHHSRFIGGTTTWDALVGGRRYSKVEFRQGDALMLGL